MMVASFFHVRIDSRNKIRLVPICPGGRGARGAYLAHRLVEKLDELGPPHPHSAQGFTRTKKSQEFKFVELEKL